MADRTIEVALLGLGVVGTAVARAIQDKVGLYREWLGIPLHLRRILVRDSLKPRDLQLTEGIITTDYSDISEDKSVQIVVEVMGGEHPAYEYIKAALEQGRYVVTANKEVIAKHGSELLALAAKSGVDLFYEASVGGGIPIVSSLKRDLSANEIRSVRAIINGTTNYILTRMSRDGIDFREALAQAQALGYAEADPSNDVEGRDAVYKLAILASLAFQCEVKPDAVHQEGITRLTARDFRYARELGYAIKLLAVADRQSDGSGALQARVYPALVPEEELLSKVDGVLNAVEVEGDLAGRVLFQGAGAGSLPTTSAVMADVLDAAMAISQHRPPASAGMRRVLPLRPMSELVTRYYVRLLVVDRPGVLADIARCFGQNSVSIASVIQKENDEEAQTAELVIMTHPAREAAMQETMLGVKQLKAVRDIGNLLRVEG